MNDITAIILTSSKSKAKKSIESVSFADKLLVIENDAITNYSKVRNDALKKVKSEWALFVDSDEEVSSALAREIKSAVKNKNFNGYFISRIDTFLGKKLKHGENGNIRLLRLARVDYGEFERPVHEVWDIKGSVGRLKSPLLHYPHDSISSFLSKINHYSTIEAEYRRRNNVRSSLFKLAFFPLAKFISNYIFKLGFLDGTPGLIMAIMMSFHSFQTWTKLYLLQKNK